MGFLIAGPCNIRHGTVTCTRTSLNKEKLEWQMSSRFYVFHETRESILYDPVCPLSSASHWSMFCRIKDLRIHFFAKLDLEMTIPRAFRTKKALGPGRSRGRRFRVRGRSGGGVGGCGICLYPMNCKSRTVLYKWVVHVNHLNDVQFGSRTQFHALLAPK